MDKVILVFVGVSIWVMLVFCVILFVDKLRRLSAIDELYAENIRVSKERNALLRSIALSLCEIEDSLKPASERCRP